MADDLCAPLRSCRFVLAWQYLLAALNGSFCALDIAVGYWGPAAVAFASLALTVAIHFWITRPRYRRLKQAARDLRIVELEKELGFR